MSCEYALLTNYYYLELLMYHLHSTTNLSLITHSLTSLYVHVHTPHMPAGQSFGYDPSAPPAELLLALPAELLLAPPALAELLAWV